MKRKENRLFLNFTIYKPIKHIDYPISSVLGSEQL